MELQSTPSATLLTTTLELPSTIYYKDPYATIRSILGNDITINSIFEHTIILPNNNILVDVTYSSLDFNSFIIYKTLETKTLNNITSKTIITKIYDPIQEKELDVLIMCPVKSDYITIKYLSNVNFSSDKNIKYYSLPVNTSTTSNIFHNYCSAIDTSFLSYHGTSIPHTPKFNISNTLSCGDISKELSKLSNISSIASNNFSKPHTLLSTPLADINFELINLKDFKDPFKNYIISLDKCTYSDIYKLIDSKAIIIINKYRINCNSIIYISDLQSNITKEIVDNVITVLDYDLFNMNMLKIKE